MERNTKIAIGIGYLIWSQFKAFICLLWMFFVILIIWVVVYGEKSPPMTPERPFGLGYTEEEASKYTSLALENMQIEYEEKMELLNWAKNADLAAVAKMRIEEHPEAITFLRISFRLCRKAVKLNSVDTMDGIIGCEPLQRDFIDGCNGVHD